MITVNAGNSSRSGVRGGSGTSSALTVEDAEAIRNEVQGVQFLAVGVQSQAQVVAGNQNWFTRIQGTDIDLPEIRAWQTGERARSSAAQDVAGAAKVAVLGKTVSDMLFGADRRPVGQIIRIRNQPFRSSADGRQGSDRHGTGQRTIRILAPYDDHGEAARPDLHP